MKQPALKVKGLSVRLGGHQILDNVEFEVPKGQLTYILGANGSGKTTLVRTLLGLQEADSGSIKLFGKTRTQELVASYMGYVPQYSEVERDFPISVDEVIKLACDTDRCSLGVAGHLKLFDIDHLATRKISNLSGGEFQKVLIARALVNQPEILILDEPINNLDLKSQEDLLANIRKINKHEKITILIISHDHHIINEKTDHVLHLSNHDVIAGKAKEILHDHKLVKRHEHI
ncbi:MAG: metal ABC transporter ATP-binding protein [Candidatus Dojkabacteria bacterium]